MSSRHIDFIQIGANIGATDTDIIWKFIRKKGNTLKGIFIEPVPESFEKLKENYSDLTGNFFENVAILDFNGKTNIYVNSKSNENQQASVIKSHWEANNLELVVNCVTLKDIIEKYDLIDVPFELLQIDAEAVDDVILLSTDFTHILPRFIRYEHIHLSSDRQKAVLSHLKKFGYIEMQDVYNEPQIQDGYDTMMVRMIIRGIGEPVHDSTAVSGSWFKRLWARKR